MCALGEEYDLCCACYAATGALAPELWPHAHGRHLFALVDAAAEEEEDEEDEADSAARAAAEADSFFASGGSPRQLAPAFAEQPQARASPAAAGGAESLQEPMSAHKLST